MDLTVLDNRVFVPARDFQCSREFYLALGWKENWRRNQLAELELGGVRFLLQDHYDQGWAENFMLQIIVVDAQAWFEHVRAVLANKQFGAARTQPPKREPWGFLVTYVWDPCGVLLHIAQKL